MYDRLCENLSQIMTRVMEICAVPRRLDNDLALAMLHRFTNFNSSSRMLLAELYTFPFIYPHDCRSWRFTESARRYFLNRLMQRDGEFLEITEFVKCYYEDILQHASDPESPEARETEWNIIYHLTPLKPRDSIDKLNRLFENAVQKHRLSDMMAVVDLVKEQETWLASYKLELLYFEGCYAFARGDLELAESRLTTVWELSEPSRMKATAGYVLGVIKLHSKRQPLNSLHAVELLSKALSILDEMKSVYVKARVLDSLGTALIQIGGRQPLESASKYLAASAEIWDELGDVTSQAVSLKSLSIAQLRIGSREQLEAAKENLRRSQEISENLGDVGSHTLLLSTLDTAPLHIGSQWLPWARIDALQRSLNYADPAELFVRCLHICGIEVNGRFSVGRRIGSGRRVFLLEMPGSGVRVRVISPLLLEGRYFVEAKDIVFQAEETEKFRIGFIRFNLDFTKRAWKVCGQRSKQAKRVESTILPEERYILFMETVAIGLTIFTSSCTLANRLKYKLDSALAVRE